MLGIALPGFGGARCLRIVANPMIETILLLELGWRMELANKLLATLSGGRISSMDRDGYISGLAV
jgi:hypothetical protein